MKPDTGNCCLIFRLFHELGRDFSINLHYNIHGTIHKGYTLHPISVIWRRLQSVQRKYIRNPSTLTAVTAEWEGLVGLQLYHFYPDGVQMQDEWPGLNLCLYWPNVLALPLLNGLCGACTVSSRIVASCLNYERKNVSHANRILLRVA